MFYNEEIRVNTKSIFNNACFNVGVYYVSDLMISTDKFVSHKTFCSNFKINVNFLEFLGWVSAVKAYLTKYPIKESNPVNHINVRPIRPSLFEILFQSTSGAKPLYNLLNTNNDVPTSQASWESSFQAFNTND